MNLGTGTGAAGETAIATTRRYDTLSPLTSPGATKPS